MRYLFLLSIFLFGCEKIVCSGSYVVTDAGPCACDKYGTCRCSAMINGKEAVLLRNPGVKGQRVEKCSNGYYQNKRGE